MGNPGRGVLRVRDGSKARTVVFVNTIQTQRKDWTIHGEQRIGNVQAQDVLVLPRALRRPTEERRRRSLTTGRRLPDTVFGKLPDNVQPGDYWKYLDESGKPMKPISKHPGQLKGNLTKTVWGYFSPDGNGVGTLMIHTVREEEDGTISVRPGDGSSNSILHKGAGATNWHGYVEHGTWNAV